MTLRGTIFPTDYSWYDFLVRHPRQEINFWTPSNRRPFKAPPFSPFLFKLKSPHNAICGFGYFARWASLPDWLAWDAFGDGNGASTLQELRARITALRQRIGYEPPDRVAAIGCILIVEPVWFPPGQWVPQPTDWPRTTVTGKAYDLSLGEGRRVWDACQSRAGLTALAALPTAAVATPTGPRYGAPREVIPRLGQGTFRVAVTQAYEEACAITTEHSLPVLEAAHIRAYGQEGPHEIPNGILLRADLHRLFDQGYLTVTPEYRVEVSPRLRADYSNGHSYYPWHGKRIRLPQDPGDRPARDYLVWHNDNRYQS